MNKGQALAATLVGFVVATVTWAGDYAVVDTGQTGFYNNTTAIAAPSFGDAFYGQDAQFAGNQPSYTVSGDGLTVLDTVTGLTWTQGADWSGNGVLNASDKMTYAEAVAYVDTLNAQNYGGYNDWQLPSIKQLYSLIDYRGTDPNPMAGNSAGLTPFIDDSAFEFAYGDTSAGERIIDSQWATSTLYVGTVMNGTQAMFGVNFADGRIKGYPAVGGPGGVDKEYYVRFCRGNDAYGVNDFKDNGNGTISDGATDLMWAQSDSGVGMGWEDALAWVQQKNAENYLGHNDWRLPNAKELQSLLDYTRSPDTTGSAAIDPLFDATAITNEAGQADYAFYWSGTTFLRFTGSASAAVYVCFGRGLGSMNGVDVIDVHGAGCQRSDPKDGDPGDYPSWGNGPQGDVQRVFNYVRLVRDFVEGDYDFDGDVDDVDIDLFIGKLGGTAPDDAPYDLDGDGQVTLADYEQHATTLLRWENTAQGQSGWGTVLADCNRDGEVTLVDLNTLGASFGQAGGWAAGDANGDGQITLADLNALGVNFGQGVLVAPEAGAAVTPEPAGLLLLGLGGLAIARRRAVR